jgi:hypothetical protein
VSELADRLGGERLRPDQPQHLRKVPADERADGAEHVLRSAAHFPKAELRVDHVHAERVVLDQVVERVAVAPQLLFGASPLGDVVEENADGPALGPADAEGVHVIPAAVQRLRLVRESHRLAGAGDPAVRLEPVGLVARRQLAHPPPRRPAQAGVPLERGVRLEEEVVNRLAALVEEYFDHAEAFVDGLEQGAVLPLAPPQRLLCRLGRAS